MSGQLKEVRTRIKSVQSTQQITKAMKMVSAAKLRKGQEAITQLRPYANKLKQLFLNIASTIEGENEFPLTQVRPINKIAIVLITSDRGLCGGYNVNLIKTALELLKTKYSNFKKENQIEIISIGKKGYEYFKKREFVVNETYKDILLKLDYQKIRECSKYLCESFLDKKYDHIEIIYSEFKNAATQIMTSEQFLPMVDKKEIKISKNKIEYIYQPDKKTLLNNLIPLILQSELMKGILDSIASEHGARMTAMDKATENANEILKKLKISYNRARQAAITTELSEIVSGAIALEG